MQTANTLYVVFTRENGKRCHVSGVSTDGRPIRWCSKHDAAVYCRDDAESAAQCLAEYLFEYPSAGFRVARTVGIVPVSGGVTHWRPALPQIPAKRTTLGPLYPPAKTVRFDSNQLRAVTFLPQRCECWLPAGEYTVAGESEIDNGQHGMTGQWDLTTWERDPRSVDDVAYQTRRIFEWGQQVLAECGLTLEDVVSTTTFLCSMKDLETVSGVKREFFPAADVASTTVEVAALVGTGEIEINFIAVFPDGK